MKNRAETVETKNEHMKLILPPPEIRKIIDKTAQFIATRGGEDLERTIREREQDDAKFSFLAIDDPYHAYYLVQLEVMQETGELLAFGDGNLPEEEQEDLLDENERDAKRQKTRQDEDEKEREQLPVVPELEFLINGMPKISHLDFDIIKLTSLFAARNGEKFLKDLQARERGNVQFEFLNPSHSCHSLFQQLIKQYQMILQPSQDLLQQVEMKKPKFRLLEQCVDRSQVLRYQEQDRLDRHRQAQEDEQLQALVDWHDFVIVQTIDFTDWDMSESSKLPVPITIRQLQSMTLAERENIMTSIEMPPTSIGTADEGGEQEMEMSDED